jgi:type IV pilus assembly protein PilQ
MQMLKRLALVMIAALVVAPTSIAQTVNITLDGVEVTPGTDSNAVTLTTSSRAYAGVSKTADPLQIMVQLDGTSVGLVPPRVEVNSEFINVVTVEQLSDAGGVFTKIVIGLNRDVEYTATPTGNQVVIDLFPKGAGPDRQDDLIATEVVLDEEDVQELSSVRGSHTYYGGGANKVQGVDFKSFRTLSRIIITGDQPIQYDAAPTSENRMVLTLHDASLGTGLERRLDTTRFLSAVEAVSTYQSRQVRTDVMVVVDLIESIQPEVKTLQGGTILQLDFPVPDSVAAARADVVPEIETWLDTLEPEDVDPEAGKLQQSATGQETLITGGGRSDPGRASGRSAGLFGSEGVFLQPRPGHRYRGRRMNMDLVNADIHNVFRMISHVSKVNIISSDNVQGTVSVRLTDVPWDQALAAILQAKGLGATQLGNIIRVAPIDVIKSEQESALQAEKARLERLPLDILTLPLNYANAKEVSETIKQIISERGSISVDTRTNTLVIEDVGANITKARELVKTLDRKTPQVLIEARIVEVNTSYQKELGIQWGGGLNFTPGTGAPTGVWFPNAIGLSGGRDPLGAPTNYTSAPNYVVDLPAASGRNTLALTLGSIGGIINLDARLAAMESNGTGRVVSTPRITTVTNKQARVKQGSRVPFQTVSVRGTQTQFVDAVVELVVTPHITSDRTVFLDVMVTKDRPDFSTTVDGQPVIEKKEAETLVMVRDGDTAVIGGVYSVEETSSHEGVPGLKNVPVIGAIFRRKLASTERKEMLVFLTPKILVDETERAGKL